jgi:hypothetical protein
MANPKCWSRCLQRRSLRFRACLLREKLIPGCKRVWGIANRKDTPDSVITMTIHEAIHAFDINPSAGTDLEDYKTEFRAGADSHNVYQRIGSDLGLVFLRYGPKETFESFFKTLADAITTVSVLSDEAVTLCEEEPGTSPYARNGRQLVCIVAGKERCRSMSNLRKFTRSCLSLVSTIEVFRFSLGIESWRKVWIRIALYWSGL